VQRGLSGSTAVSGRLALTDTTLSSAQQAEPVVRWQTRRCAEPTIGAANTGA
jgi:hypothetical protein